MRSLRTGQARLDRREVELQHVGEDGVGRRGGAEEALLLRVALHEVHLGRAASRLPQVGERFVVHREEAAGGPVLGGHIGDGGAVGEAHLREPGAEELDELLDDALLPEHLGHGEDEIGRGRAFAQLPHEPEADDLRGHHVERLAEHGRLGLDPSDTPAEDPEAVDHRGVGVGADQRVGHRHGVAALGLEQHALRQVFEVYLVDDPGRGRHHPEAGERFLAPAEELVSLTVALEFDLGVLSKGVLRSEDVHLHRVIHHEVHGHERVDPLRVGAEALHRRAHGGEIHDGGDTGEILEDDARGHEGQLDVLWGRGVPGAEVPDIVRRHELTVHAPQDGLEQDLDREGEPGEPRGDTRLLERLQAVDRGPAEAGVEGRAGAERIGLHGFPLCWATPELIPARRLAEAAGLSGS